MARRTNVSSKGKDRKIAPGKGILLPGAAGNKQQSPGRRPGPKAPGGRRKQEER
jgi:hypothetical protein